MYEQRVVRPSRGLGHCERGGVREPVGSAGHELLEGQASIGPGVSVRAYGSRFPVGVMQRRDVRGWSHSLSNGETVAPVPVRVDLDADDHVRLGLVEGVGEEIEVAAFDAGLLQAGRHDDRQGALVEGSRSGTAEGGSPDSVAHLAADALGAASPDPFRFGVGVHLSISFLHRLIHSCGQSFSVARSGGGPDPDQIAVAACGT